VCVRHDGVRECGEERMGLFIVHRTRIMYAPMPLPNNTPRTQTHTHTRVRDRAGECKYIQIKTHVTRNILGPRFILFLDIIDTRIL